MTILTRPVLTINLSNLCNNYNYIKGLAPDSIAAAVVKDDAYGLGAIEVAKALYNNCGCNTFFVAHAFEGELVAPHVPNAKIYVLNGIGDDSISSFKKANLIPVISSPEHLRYWQQNKISGITPAIQVETGLNRLGFSRSELDTLTIQELKDFSLVISHLACADDKAHELNQTQLNNFNDIHQKYFPSIKASLAASDGVFLGSDYKKDVIRLGAGIYGIHNTQENKTPMSPVISITAPVLKISELKPEEAIGYSATFKTTKKTTIAVISIGYGDGLPRNLSNTGKVFFNNQEAKILGRVSMDSIVCDITNIKDINTGDMASIIDDVYTINSFAKDAATIGYEVASRFGKNPRFIKKYI